MDMNRMDLTVRSHIGTGTVPARYWYCYRFFISLFGTSRRQV